MYFDFNICLSIKKNVMYIFILIFPKAMLPLINSLRRSSNFLLLHSGSNDIYTLDNSVISSVVVCVFMGCRYGLTAACPLASHTIETKVSTAKNVLNTVFLKFGHKGNMHNFSKNI